MDAKLIIENLKKQKSNIKNTYKANIIGLFGSSARGEERPGSDIDLLVEFDSDADFINYMALTNYLESILGQKVDLVSAPYLREMIRPMVMKDLKKI
ncbi:MAG: nucleotidyltransferase family protein [Candidatus Margulisiibacteriota bacterium]